MQKVNFLIIFSWIAAFTVEGEIDDVLTSLEETQNSKEFISLSASRQENNVNDEKNSKMLNDRTRNKFTILYINTKYKQKSQKVFMNYKMENFKPHLLITNAENVHSRNLKKTETFYTNNATSLNGINTPESNKAANLKSELRNSNLIIRNGLKRVIYTIKNSKNQVSNLVINTVTRNDSMINFKNTKAKTVAEYSKQSSRKNTITNHLRKSMNRNTLNVSLSSSNPSYRNLQDIKISSTSQTPFPTRLSKNVVASIVAAVIAFIGFTGSAVFVYIKHKCRRYDEERRPLIRQHLDNVLQNK